MLIEHEAKAALLQGLLAAAQRKGLRLSSKGKVYVQAEPAQGSTRRDVAKGDVCPNCYLGMIPNNSQRPRVVRPCLRLLYTPLCAAMLRRHRHAVQLLVASRQLQQSGAVAAVSRMV